MDIRAIDKARRRIEAAQEALDSLGAARDFREFDRHWFSFLICAKGVYVVLEQGAKASAQSRQWFGEKNKERKSDPLLQYLYEARNAAEHGLEDTTAIMNGDVILNDPGPGDSQSLRFDVSESGDLTVRSLDGGRINVRFTGAYVALAPVKARGFRTYDPPTMHLGAALNDILPANVGRLALTYLNGLVEEAVTLT